ncbi:uncharacterized protein F5Z01DRAFT_28360 [Emericellopsis atlantica]|uniref:Uncharacterized protein n=1 Tax=Emericellopsis atlantica TaxID=2614577 RepID=A0A9P7ZXK2_9HYPO|nr:uncharacterized protein F5Z01DRAFT_28360 [Emericellopsis atlantica]KAG9259175.1 hypothetical protein F5Z01DRAFT_28360 [Emericellopsis atlantica]
MLSKVTLATVVIPGEYVLLAIAYWQNTKSAGRAIAVRQTSMSFCTLWLSGSLALMARRWRSVTGCMSCTQWTLKTGDAMNGDLL